MLIYCNIPVQYHIEDAEQCDIINQENYRRLTELNKENDEVCKKFIDTDNNEMTKKQILKQF